MEKILVPFEARFQIQTEVFCNEFKDSLPRIRMNDEPRLDQLLVYGAKWERQEGMIVVGKKRRRINHTTATICIQTNYV